MPGVPLREQAQNLRVSQFEMSKMTTMNFKIKVKGEEAPLRIRLEYYDTSA